MQWFVCGNKSIQWSNYFISLSHFLNHPKEKRSSWALDSRKSLNTLPFWAIGFLKHYFDYNLRIFLIRSFWKFEFPIGPPFKINWLCSLQIECATQIVCRLEQLQRRLHSICSKWFPRTFFYFPNILIELFLIATMGWWIKLQGNWGRCWPKLFFLNKSRRKDFKLLRFLRNNPNFCQFWNWRQNFSLVEIGAKFKMSTFFKVQKIIVQLFLPGRISKRQRTLVLNIPRESPTTEDAEKIKKANKRYGNNCVPCMYKQQNNNRENKTFFVWHNKHAPRRMFSTEERIESQKHTSEKNYKWQKLREWGGVGGRERVTRDGTFGRWSIVAILCDWSRHKHKNGEQITNRIFVVFIVELF